MIYNNPTLVNPKPWHIENILLRSTIYNSGDNFLVSLPHLSSSRPKQVRLYSFLEFLVARMLAPLSDGWFSSAVRLLTPFTRYHLISFGQMISHKVPLHGWRRLVEALRLGRPVSCATLKVRFFDQYCLWCYKLMVKRYVYLKHKSSWDQTCAEDLSPPYSSVFPIRRHVDYDGSRS